MTEKETIQVPNPENPERFSGLRLSRPKGSAAGIPAVISSVEHVFGEMGVGRGLKALLNVNQKDGYDCPGCAWPDPDDDRSTIAEYCENGAKAIAEEATTKRLTTEFFAANSVTSLAQLTDYEIGKKGRIAQPMYLAPGAEHYTPITWDEAFRKISDKLNSIHPDEAAFYTSGRTSNEAAFLYQLFVRQYGTNNMPDCSNMCHESSRIALKEVIGTGKGSVKLEDFYQSEVILVIGQNPGTNHPRMLSALKKAKEKGAVIISINPLPETGLIGFSDPQSVKGVLGIKARLTDLFLPVRINGDMPLLRAVYKLLLEKEEANPGKVFDTEFIRNHTEGYGSFVEMLRGLDFGELVAQSGVDEYKIREVAELLSSRKKIIACWAMGLTQHKNSVDTIKEVVNLLLLKGSIGKPGAGTCPVRGHSNVQGDFTMGVQEQPSDQLLDKLKSVFGFEPPRKHGYDSVECVKAMHEGKVRFFFAMGGNFLSAMSDTLFTADALRRCELTVQVSTKLNRSHLITGKEAIILPTLGRSDRDVVNGEIQIVSCENSMGVIQLSKGSLKPVSDQLLSEPLIVCRMALAVFGEKSDKRWNSFMEHYDNIREAIEATIDGFNDYNRRVRIPGGFYLPNSAREGRFETFSGKAFFSTAPFSEVKLEKGEYLMMTVRSHDQFNTTIYGLNDRYRGVHNERRVIFMNPSDAEREGLSKGDVVDLFNSYDGTERVAHKFIVIPFEIPSGCTATYFPETNVLVPIGSVAEKSNTPTSKSVVIRVRRHLD